MTTNTAIGLAWVCGPVTTSTTIEARGQLLSALVPCVGASVTVYQHVVGQKPTPTAQRTPVWQDELLAVPAVQPLITDQNGLVPGYVLAEQILDLLITGPQLAEPLVLTVFIPPA